MGRRSELTVDPVPGTPSETRAWYDRASGLYGLAEDLEFPATALAIRGLDLEAGERAVDLGCGAGKGVVEMARAVGDRGRAVGVDFAPGMCAETARSIRDADVDEQAAIVCGDVTELPFQSTRFDAAIASFVLDLMAPEAIESVLREANRVLTPQGRLASVSIARSDSLPTTAYRWLRDVFPHQLDCRPIPAVDLLERGGFSVDWTHEYSLYGLPVTIALARPQ